jgi:transposase
MSKSTKSTTKADSEPAKVPAKPVLSVIKDIHRQTKRQYSVEEKIRIVLEGLRGEASIAEICRREGMNPNVYYRWNGPPLRQGVPGSGQEALNGRFHSGSHCSGSAVHEDRE